MAHLTLFHFLYVVEVPISVESGADDFQIVDYIQWEICILATCLSLISSWFLE